MSQTIGDDDAIEAGGVDQGLPSLVGEGFILLGERYRRPVGELPETIDDVEFTPVASCAEVLLGFFTDVARQAVEPSPVPLRNRRSFPCLARSGYALGRLRVWCWRP